MAMYVYENGDKAEGKSASVHFHKLDFQDFDHETLTRVRSIPHRCLLSSVFDRL